MALNYQVLYTQEREFRESLQQELQEYKERSSEIEEFLEKELEEMSSTLQKKDSDISALKEKLIENKAETTRIIEKQMREIEQWKLKCKAAEESLRKDRQKMVTLENENEFHESQNRALEALNCDLESKVDGVLEELALLQTELEENKNSHESDIENIERLKQQIRDTESELYAQQVKQRLQLQQQQTFQIPQLNICSRETSSTVNVPKASPKYKPLTSRGQVKKFDFSDCLGESRRENILKQIKPLKLSFLNEKENDKNALTGGVSSGALYGVGKACFTTTNSNTTMNNNNNNNNNNHEDEDEVVVLRGRQQFEEAKQVKGTQHRYSEDRRKQLLQQTINSDKIAMYDKNISTMKLTQLGFNKSINLIVNLIKDLDDNRDRIKSKKALLTLQQRLRP